MSSSHDRTTTGAPGAAKSTDGSAPSIGNGETRRALTSNPDAAAPQFGPPAVPGEVGTLGPYRVVRQLGVGGMGVVYLAVDTRLDRELALKVMLPDVATDAGAKGRFVREARAAARLAHDNVVTVYEADERDGVSYIAMPYLRGEPLDRYLKSKGTPDGLHVLRIAAETASGLAAAHELGFVHRDIKPANIWLESPNGRVKILDFGLARPAAAISDLTGTGAVVGTPAYMSPEQARGGKVDHRTDLFSLGAVLYRLVTGRNPFRGENVTAVLIALATEEPPPVCERNPQVPPDFADLIHQLLAKEPDRRPQTADEVARRCRAIADRLAGAVTVSHVAPHAPADAFADLDETEFDSEPPAPERGRAGGRALWAAVGLSALFATAAVALVVQSKFRDQTKAAPRPDEPRRVAEKVPEVAPKSKADAEPPDPERAAVERAALARQYHKRGMDYQYGRGVERDFEKAREWYEKAALLGNPYAQNSLAYLYERGLGVEQDHTKANEWYAKSRVGLEKAAADGDDGAQNSLGYMYLNGFGVERDCVKARPLFEKAAEKGHFVAHLNLGHLYHYGCGVEQDFAKAAGHYERAATQGDAIAQARLGLLYENGQGVEKDLTRALEWYERAAAQENAQAKQAVARLKKK